ncbi:MAG: hypothetical protein R8K48_05210 [Gallionella sp.]
MSVVIILSGADYNIVPSAYCVDVLAGIQILMLVLGRDIGNFLTLWIKFCCAFLSCWTA